MSKSDFSEFAGVDYILFLKIVIKDDTATSYIKIVSVKTSAIVFINMENVDTEKVEDSLKPSEIVRYQYTGPSEFKTEMNFGAEASMSSVRGEYPSKNFGTVFDRMQLMNANIGLGLLFKHKDFIMHFMPSVGYTRISAYGIKGFRDKEVNGTNVNIDFAVIWEDTYRAGWGWRNISINNQWKSQIDSFVGIGFVKLGMAYFIGEESDGISSAFIGTYVGFLFDWDFLSKVF
jgi:hypothetical protein